MPHNSVGQGRPSLLQLAQWPSTHDFSTPEISACFFPLGGLLLSDDQNYLRPLQWVIRPLNPVEVCRKLHMTSTAILRTSARQGRRKLLHAWRAVRQPAVINHMGIRLHVGQHLPPVLKKALYSGMYERAETKIIRRHLEPDDVVLELGTGLGFVALYCAKHIGPDRIFTFEPNPELESVILRNFELNGLFPSLASCLLGKEAGNCDFFIEPDLWSSSLEPRSKQARRVSVSCRRLNDEIRRIDPTYLIMDIEGAEHALAQYVVPYNIRKIFLELHARIIGAEKARFVLACFAQMGFRQRPNADAEFVFLERSIA